jgi:RNA polymerase sigma-70 factor (ECF subfamily)
VSSQSLETTTTGELFRWFAEEIQPHEPALRAYLHGRFPSLRDQDDIVQDTYARLLRAKESGSIRHPKAFLFTMARNAALDCFRKKRPISIEGVSHLDVSAVVEEQTPDAADILNRDQELEFMVAALRSLPDRCRQVVMLRYLDGLAFKEIAAQLGIAPGTVKVHMAKGLRRCTEFFQERGLL